MLYFVFLRQYYFSFVGPQFMATGLLGVTGALVPRRVEPEHRQKSANARTPDQNMVETSVKDRDNRLECATSGIVPVCLLFNSDIYF